MSVEARPVHKARDKVLNIRHVRQWGERVNSFLVSSLGRSILRIKVVRNMQGRIVSQRNAIGLIELGVGEGGERRGESWISRKQSPRIR